MTEKIQFTSYRNYSVIVRNAQIAAADFVIN